MLCEEICPGNLTLFNLLLSVCYFFYEFRLYKLKLGKLNVIQNNINIK